MRLNGRRVPTASRARLAGRAKAVDRKSRAMRSSRAEIKNPKQPNRAKASRGRRKQQDLAKATKPPRVSVESASSSGAKSPPGTGRARSGGQGGQRIWSCGPGRAALLRSLLDAVAGGKSGPQSGPLTGGDFRKWADRLRDVEEMLDDPALRAEAARIRGGA